MRRFCGLSGVQVANVTGVTGQRVLAIAGGGFSAALDGNTVTVADKVVNIPLCAGILMTAGCRDSHNTLLECNSGMFKYKMMCYYKIVTQMCDVTSATPDIIVCALPAGGSAGQNPIRVSVAGLGLALHSGPGAPFALANPLDVTGVTPPAVGVAGGAVVTLSGGPWMSLVADNVTVILGRFMTCHDHAPRLLANLEACLGAWVMLCCLYHSPCPIMGQGVEKNRLRKMQRQFQKTCFHISDQSERHH